MRKQEQLEWRFRFRDVAYVIDWFDEEQTFPWSYVKRKEGRFEGFTNVLLKGEDDLHGEAVEVSVGVFDSIDRAAVAVCSYNAWLDAVEKLRRLEWIKSASWGELFTEVEV